MTRLALATCRVLPEPDPDDLPLQAALWAAGFQVRHLAWDAPDEDPDDLDLVLLRSTWNYYEAPGAFLAWAERVSRVARLVNPLHVIRKNIDKHYLADCRDRGVPIVPTEFLNRGSAVPDHLADVVSRHRWRRFVVKPTVSAASFHTRLFTWEQMDEAKGFVRKMLAERDMMVQPYMTLVEEGGEKAVVWIDGAITHAVRKSPRFADQDEEVSEAVPVTPAEQDVVERAMRDWRDHVVYARIDLMDSDGGPLLSELELMEPSLFFPQCPAALERFVRCLVRISGHDGDAPGG